MQQYGYSQVPVVQNGFCFGVFSYRSLAREAAQMTLDELNSQRCALADLPVVEFVERFEYARVTEEMTRVFDAMDRDSGVLIGTPERLIGILTPMDFLRYLYNVAGPFVMISEIELALRALIRRALSDVEIESAAKRCLASAYGGKDSGRIPKTLDEMTFDNYQTLVSHSQFWQSSFERVFGGTRPRTSAKLREISAIRNDLFHFKR
jgi:hypothetical protein